MAIIMIYANRDIPSIARMAQMAAQVLASPDLPNIAVILQTARPTHACRDITITAPTAPMPAQRPVSQARRRIVSIIIPTRFA